MTAAPGQVSRACGGYVVTQDRTPLTLLPYIGTDFIIDVDMIDRVKVIRGPGSALYGSNAFDQHYGYPGATQHVQDIIYQDGTTFRVKLTYRF